MKWRIVLKSSIIALIICLAVCLSACQEAAAHREFDSSCCTVDTQIDIETIKPKLIDFPLIRVKPHNIKAEEGKDFAELFLSDAKFYETNFAPEMTKAALDEKILVLPLQFLWIAGVFYAQSPVCFRHLSMREAPFLPMFNNEIANKFSQ